MNIIRIRHTWSLWSTVIISTIWSQISLVLEASFATSEDFKFSLSSSQIQKLQLKEDRELFSKTNSDSKWCGTFAIWDRFNLVAQLTHFLKKRKINFIVRTFVGLLFIAYGKQVISLKFSSVLLLQIFKLIFFAFLKQFF